jgi:exosortase B
VSATLPTPLAAESEKAAAPPRDDAIAWWLAGGSFVALMFYSCAPLWDGLWNEDAYSHGPIIVAIVLWLLWRQGMPALQAPAPLHHAIGWLLLLPALAAYVVGHVVAIPFLHVASLMPVGLALLLIVGGVAAVRTYWFSLLFLFFLVPLPDFMLEAMTGPLKNKVSFATEFILHAAGYPIARDGVVLTVGHYQLLVADACSGLNSIFSLTAMGLLYLYLMQYRSRLRNAVLVASLVPIAIVSNLLRVMFLVLLTYHAGDEAGQGFLHGFAGMFLFVVALIILFTFDRLLGHVPSIAAQERAR